MITIYIDMSLSGTSGSGTTGDPFSFLSFKSYAENSSNWTDDHDFRFRNRGYEYSDGYNMLFIGDINNKSVIFESDTNEPAVIRCTFSGAFTNQSTFEIYSPGTWNGSVVVKNLIFETVGNVEGFSCFTCYDDLDGPLGGITIMNNSFYSSCSNATNGITNFLWLYTKATIIGNTFKYLGAKSSNDVGSAVRFDSYSTGPFNNILVSSNYIEGNLKSAIVFNNRSLGDDIWNGNIRNNSVYNNPNQDFFVRSYLGNNTGITLSNNIDNHLVLVSQFPSYTGNYAGTHSDIQPQVGSALIGAAYAEAGWLTDIFGTSRSTPDIGAAEYPVVAVPEISVSPSSKSFGVTTKDVTVDQTVAISNPGTADLIVKSMTGLSAPFSLIGGLTDSTIVADATSYVTVRWNPTALGTFSQTLDMSSNADGTAHYLFNVDGTAAEPDISISPSVGFFDGIAIGNTPEQIVTVTNIGTRPLVILPVTGLSSPFRVLSDNVSDTTLAPSGSETLKVQFSPSENKSFNQTLVINSNDPDTPALSFVAYGHGLPSLYREPRYPSGRGSRGKGIGNTLYDRPGDGHNIR